MYTYNAKDKEKGKKLLPVYVNTLIMESRF